MTPDATFDFRASARRTLTLEQQALNELIDKLDVSFDHACRTLLECRGRIIVTGMGKSGHIARKMAATFASTGSPAFYLHPGEASHGDLGMVTEGDVVIALSNSGETQEITGLIALFKRLGAPLISLTGRPHSTLARYSDVHIDVGVSREACPHDLAPTSSTTAALAMGDALALALLEARGFSPEDFALFGEIQKLIEGASHRQQLVIGQCAQIVDQRVAVGRLGALAPLLGQRTDRLDPIDEVSAHIVGDGSTQAVAQQPDILPERFVQRGVVVRRHGVVL